MVYIPLQCDQINFNLSGTYFIPECSIVNFNFGIGGDLEIRTHDSEIIIDMDSCKWFSGMMVIPSGSEILIKSDTSIVDPLIEIVQKSAEVSILTDDLVVEILPDMIMKNSSMSMFFDKGIVRTPGPENLPSGIAPRGTKTGWEKINSVMSHKRIPWGDGEDIKKYIRSPVIGPEKPDHDVNNFWRALENKDNQIIVPSERFDYFFDVSKSSPWITMYHVDDVRKSTWGANLLHISDQVFIPYNEPGENDASKITKWDVADDYDWHLKIPWGEPGGKDADKKNAWGPFSYYALCENFTKYYAPKACSGINFSFPNKYELVSDVCEGIRFNVNAYSSDPRCPYNHWHSGERDSGSGIIPRIDDVTYPLAQKVYYMLNTVLVEEVVTKTPIEVLHVDAKIDRSSWLWSFNVTVADKCYLDLIKPVNGVMGHIKINMNGYVWFCSVEGWSENRSFGTQAWTITGRSPSMMFGDPISQKSNGLIADPAQGQNIIENIVTAKQLPPDWPVDFQGWTSDFSDYSVSGKVSSGFKPYSDWYVPGNTVSYTDKTEIDVIKELSSAIGAYVQTEPDANKLTVKPLFAHQPWNWETSNSDIEWITMNESQLVEIGRSNELKPFYQGIHVIGESIGGSDDGTGVDPSNTAVAVEVRRSEYGPGTADYAPMVTSPYITSAKAGLEYGRMVLAQTGEWVRHTLRIGTLCPDGTSFGLFKTGDMISVIERGTPWQGQVVGVSVGAVSAGAGFALEQVIEVEEYRGV